jgi:hypothetical protein
VLPPAAPGAPAHPIVIPPDKVPGGGPAQPIYPPPTAGQLPEIPVAGGYVLVGVVGDGYKLFFVPPQVAQPKK